MQKGAETVKLENSECVSILAHSQFFYENKTENFSLKACCEPS